MLRLFSTCKLVLRSDYIWSICGQHVVVNMLSANFNMLSTGFNMLSTGFSTWSTVSKCGQQVSTCGQKVSTCYNVFKIISYISHSCAHKVMILNPHFWSLASHCFFFQISLLLLRSMQVNVTTTGMQRSLFSWNHSL